jgi:signal transduction histidine kinase
VRIVIEDVKSDPAFAPYSALAAAAGFRAVQCTPLLDSDGKPVGMFSTHFPRPHRPSPLELVQFDLYAHQTAQFIERVKNEVRLQRLTRALLVSQEEAQRATARELHDVFSQELVAIAMEITSMKQDGRTKAGETGRFQALAQQISDLATRIHQTSRRLHPAVLDDLGLTPALRQECESFQQTSGIATEFSPVHIPPDIPGDVALCLYRVAQEALRNISKHAAESDMVVVSLTGGGDAITLTVRDKGDGFELDHALRKGGLGLISMDERVRAENGVLTVQSTPGEGTTVTAFIPLHDAQPEGPPRIEESEAEKSKAENAKA